MEYELKKKVLEEHLKSLFEIEKNLSLEVQAVSEKVTRLQADLIKMEKEQLEKAKKE